MVRTEVVAFDRIRHTPKEPELPNPWGFTLLVEGIPAASAGLFDGPRGREAWVVIRCAFTRHLREFLVLSRYFAEARCRNRDLWAHVVIGDPVIERWLRFVGFEFYEHGDYYDLYRRPKWQSA